MSNLKSPCTGFFSKPRNNEETQDIINSMTSQGQEMKQAIADGFQENKEDRDKKHGEVVTKVDNLTESVRKIEQILQGGRQQPTPAKLQFGAPAATGDSHLGKDIVVADEETTTATEQSSNSSTVLKSITADESLPDATKEEAVDLKDSVDVNLKDMDANVEKSAPLDNTKSTTVDLSLPADTKDEAIDFKTVEVKVEKESLASTAPRTPGPRNSTTRATGLANSTHSKPPTSINKRRFAATPQSMPRLSKAESAHVERRKRGRVKETANSEAKTVNVKHEQIFQRRQTRSASKKQPPSGSR